MPYRNTPFLNFPLGNMKRISSRFGTRNFYDNMDWGIHLGIDISVPAQTKVFSIGRGVVVYSKIHPGEFSETGKIIKRNWGGIVITAHKNPKTKKTFYSLYGHLGVRYVKKGDKVELGELIGTVGKSMSESNGIWEEEHLHFGIYEGPFHFRVLPGYFREKENNTDPDSWKDPVSFIRKYNQNFA